MNGQDVERALPVNAGVLLLLLISLVSPALGNTEFLVNSISDNGNANPGDGNCNTGQWTGIIAECTLRAAIEEANQTGGTVDINFSSSIETNSWDFSDIVIGSGLPAITSPVNIDGRTHPDFDDSTEYPQPRVRIRWDGGSAQWSAIRLNSGASGSSIRGLSIVDFTASGIRVAGGGGYTIADNIIGGLWLPNLVSAPGNARHGIDFNGGSTSQASTAVFNNIIFANEQHGILMRNGISDAVIVDNVIGLGPVVGTDSDFQPEWGNGGDGIRIAADAGPNNSIVNLFASRGNVLSNNGGRGLSVLADNQIVYGNKIGVANGDEVADGFTHADYGNGGVALVIESSNNQIGGVEESLWNVIGNSAFGIRIGSDSPAIAADNNSVTGNYVGVTPLGDAVAMIDGIRIENGSDNTISRAVVSNNYVGIRIENLANDTLVTRSRIVDNSFGISVLSPTELGASNSNSGNLIGNSSTGIFVGDGAGVVRMSYNWIGVDTNTTPMPNEIGIWAYGSNTLLVGHLSRTNIIGHSSDTGILIDEDVTFATIRGNLIGILPDGTPAPNNTGIRFSGEPQWRIRIGYQAQETIPDNWLTWRIGNIIAHNTGAGVDLTDGGNSTLGNPIRGNQFFGNGIGIDLGMPALDTGGTATGPNDRMNFPQFDHAATSVNPEDGLVSLRFRVEASPEFTDFPLLVDFYLADGDSAQGSYFVGTAQYEEGSAMNWQDVELAMPDGFSFSGFLTATATDADGNTSQFSLEPTELIMPDPLFDDRFEAP